MPSLQNIKIPALHSGQILQDENTLLNGNEISYNVNEGR